MTSSTTGMVCMHSISAIVATSSHVATSTVCASVVATSTVTCVVDNPFIPGVLFYLYKLEELIHHFGGVWFVYYHYRKCCEFYAKNADPDQMSHFAASDLGLQCLPVSFFWQLGITVKILKFGIPQTIAIIVLKIEKFDVTLH